MADYDVIVIGGGPAGYAAALKAAEFGASVALIEAEKPGGACVHHACIPTHVLVDSALRFVEARELGVLGVFEAGDQFNFARAVARKDALVKQMSDGIRTALRMRKVAVIEGRAEFASPTTVSVSGASGISTLSAEAFVVATGTRWDAPALPGVAPERVLTADAVQALAVAPASAVVLVDGPGEAPFGLEYAVLLAIAGSAVTVATGRPTLIPALDGTLAGAVRAGLGDLGIAVFERAEIFGSSAEAVELRQAERTVTVDAEIVVATDVRRPYFETLNLAAAGVVADTCIPVDRACRTNVPHIFAAGDVTGGVMLSSAASHMGEAAGANAAGASAVTRLGSLPKQLHTLPAIAWVGITEEAARAMGHDVLSGVFDLAFNARAIALGARTGLVKVVAERDLGEILGVHAVGPGADEIVAVAASLMQAEATIQDLASMVAWHPSMSEGLIEAAKRALA